VIVYGGTALWRAGADLQWQRFAIPGDGVDKLASTADPDKFFAVAKRQNATVLVRTDTGGASWVEVAEALPFDCASGVCELTASDDGGVLLADAHVSRDGGKTWEVFPPETRHTQSSAIQRQGGPWLVEGPKELTAAMQAALNASVAGPAPPSTAVEAGKSAVPGSGSGQIETPKAGRQKPAASPRGLGSAQWLVGVLDNWKGVVALVIGLAALVGAFVVSVKLGTWALSLSRERHGLRVFRGS
jgi:hypothetical protein